MSERDNGGPAWPTGLYADESRSGMTLRDWFAGQADVSSALGLLHKEGCEELIGQKVPEGMAGQLRWHFAVLAKLRQMAADAMLEARK